MNEIKIEPGSATVSQYDEIVKKRKAQTKAIPVQTATNHINASLNCIESAPDSTVSTATAKLSTLQSKLQSSLEKPDASSASSSISSLSTKSTTTMSSNRQKISYTQVEYKVYYVEDGPDSGKIPACITIANIFGMKDILLRNQPMASGKMFYWPAKMIYATTVQNLMSERRINFEDSKFLRTVTNSTSGQNRPLVILSFLSGKQIKRFSLKSLPESTTSILFCLFHQVHRTLLVLCLSKKLTTI